MDAISGIIGVLVLFGIGWVILKAKNGAWKQANQKVLFRGSHQEGQTLVSTALNIDTLSSSAKVAHAVRVGTDLPTGVQSAVIAQMYIESATDDGVTFAMGSKVGSSFRSTLRLQPNGEGTLGVYVITNWTLSDGIVANIKEMRFLEARIRESILAIDANATFTESASAPA
ncbi:hypothetical protein ACFQ9V_13115 [Leifsonia sp. NPDC056665]|uniref:hypothetical protein n=1 Tax=Leifsonia sp. NPDC056665 TaxID=3345901 RepID=UPI00368F84C9